MDKKFIIGLILVLAVILIAVGIYWQSRKVAISPIESEIAAEEKSFEQDITELEKLEGDVSLEGLEKDLSDIAEEEVVSEAPTVPTKKIEIASIENLTNELEVELGSFSNDLDDLGGLEGDASLDNLDSGLSSAAE